MAKKIITADGSVSYYNEKIDESYHSNTGAIEESFLKFVKPAVDLVLKENRSSIEIFDMFFGLGYNSVCVLYYLREVKGFKGKINITGIELDNEIMGFAKDITFDSSINTVMLAEAGIQIDVKKFNSYYSSIRENVDIIIGDALVEVKNIKKRFDILFFDPFSPKKQPELWSREFFKDVSRSVKSGGVLTTYSCARVAKDGLIEAGFTVMKGPSVGRKAPSTIALKN